MVHDMETLIIAAQSLDGWITRGDEPGDAFTSEADKIHFKNLVRSCDCWIMGSATYRVSKDRLARPLTPDLRRLVWTRTPTAWAAEAVPGCLEFTDAPPAEITARLRALGHRRCALLGGAQVNGAWLRAHLVDRLIVTVEPHLFGGGTPLAHLASPLPLRLDAMQRLPASEVVRLDYTVISPASNRSVG